MIGIFHEKIKGIPSLIAVNKTKQYEALPLMIYFHGFTSAKEHNLPIAYLLARQGFRVVLPDSLHHGEREDKNETEVKRQLSFWDIVLANVKELKDIKDFFEKKKLILDDRIGIAGTSMGGITTAASLTQYPWIKAAAILMGTPKATQYAHLLIENYKEAGKYLTKEQIQHAINRLHDYDLSLHIDRLDNRPLLFWHGENDSVVPFKHSYTFYNEAQTYYQNSNMLRFLREKERDHKVSRHAILETEKWFVEHLG